MKPFFCLLFSLIAIPVVAGPLTGRVSDATGRPLPRALVRVLDASGKALSEALTQPDGTFTIETTATECRVEASLTGFATTILPCAPAPEFKLALAPLHEAVLVTATRGETPASQLAASASVFPHEEIARRNTPPVADLLATSPGVTLSRSGGYGNVTSIFVRGGESNYNKVLLDGIPLNEPGGTFNFSNVTSENLERVEIVRGAHSALFGSDAMTSVIQLFTRRAASGEAPQFAGDLEGGWYGTWRARASVRGTAGAFDYSLSGAHFATDNREPNNQFDNNTATASVGYQLRPRASLRGVFRAEVGDAGTPGQTAFGRPDMDAGFDRRDLVGGVTFLQDVSTVFRHRATYGLATTRQSSANLEIDPPYTPAFEDHVGAFEFSDFPFHSRNTLRRHYATYQADWTLRGASLSTGVHQLTGVVDWDGERGTLEDVLAESATDISRNNFGLTLQHQGSWARLFTTVGVRLEDNESFGRSAAPRGSVAFIAHRSDGNFGETKLKASGGKGSRNPPRCNHSARRRSSSAIPSWNLKKPRRSSSASSSASRSRADGSKSSGSTAASRTSSALGQSASRRSRRSTSTSARPKRAGSSSWGQLRRATASRPVAATRSSNRRSPRAVPPTIRCSASASPPSVVPATQASSKLAPRQIA